jgi:hypothetical protein
MDHSPSEELEFHECALQISIAMELLLEELLEVIILHYWQGLTDPESVSAVPEPTSMALVAVGIAGWVGRRATRARRRFKSPLQL